MQKIIEKSKIYFIVIFPIFFLMHSFVLNFALVLASIIVIYDFIKNNNYFSFVIEKKWIYFFIFFWVYTIFLGILSNNELASFKSSFSQIRFFLLVFFFSIYFHQKYLSLLVKVWSLIIFLVCVDTYVQFFTGIDFFGYKAEQYGFDFRSFNFYNFSVGRLSGPFGTEYIVGAFLIKISASILFVKILKFRKNFLFIIFITFIIFASGERLSSILALLVFLSAAFFYINYKQIISFLIILISLFVIMFNFSDYFKYRINDAVNIVKNIKDSSYGHLYQSSFYLWKQNYIFGLGLKNYRFECDNLKTKNISEYKNWLSNFGEVKITHQICSSHPHNLLLELLVETGIVGFFLFSLFLLFFYKTLIKNYLMNKKKLSENDRALFKGSLIMTLLCLVPVLPSGSFFSTFNASLFWLNASLSYAVVNLNYLKK